MLNSLLTKLRSDNFAALKGAMVNGRLPVREAILNELLTEMRKTRDLPTKRLEIRLNAGNQFTLYLQPQIGPLSPVVKLDFEIIPEVNVSGAGVLTLRSLGVLGGPTAQLVRTVLLRGLKLPEQCVRVEGSAIHLYLREALAARGAADIATILQTLRFTTRSGILYVVFTIAI